MKIIQAKNIDERFNNLKYKEVILIADPNAEAF